MFKNKFKAALGVATIIGCLVLAHTVFKAAVALLPILVIAAIGVGIYFANKLLGRFKKAK
jgi:hypothetical protein